MPLHAATTLRGALFTLGQYDDAWLETVDRLLGRVLSGTTIQQSMHGLFGWIGGEVPKLVQDALKRTTREVPSHRGLARRETVSAVHTVLVVKAFFDLVRETLPDTADPRIPAANDWHQEDHSFVSYLYSDEIPAPSARGFADNVAEVSRWAADRGERVHRALRRTTPRTASEILLAAGFTQKVTDRYKADYLTYAAQIPEFALWASPTRESLKLLSAMVLTDASQIVQENLRSVLHGVNRTMLAQPLLGDVDLPALGDVYVSPNYRMTTVKPLARLADDNWWSAEVELRSGLDVLLASHLTSAESTRTPLLVTGGPGAGKSVLAKVLAAGLPDDEFAVVHVPLRNTVLGASVVEQIEVALHDLTNGQVTWGDIARQSSDQVRVVVLDGLDEMPTTSQRSRSYLDEVVKFQQTDAAFGRPVAVVVTSRTSFLEQAVLPVGIPVVQLAEFDNSQISQWVESWNQAVPDRPMTLGAALAQAELARNPLGLLMLTLQATDPAAPRSSRTLSMAELIQHAAEALNTVQAGIPYPAVAALGMFNRGRQSISEAELRDDLAALGQPAQEPVDSVLRDLDARPAAFADFQIAAFVLLELRAVMVSKRGDAPDDLLFAVLSHRPLALRPSALTFVTQLVEDEEDSQRKELAQLLDDLLRGYRDRRNTGRYSGYRPTSTDTTGSLAAYSANLVLLRLFLQPADDVMRVDLELSDGLVDLWSVGLNSDGLRSMRSLVLVDGEVIIRRPSREVRRAEQLDPGSPPPGVEVVHRASITGPEAVGQVTWSSDGELLTANSGGHVTCWRFTENSAPEPVGDLHSVSDVAWHPTRPIAAVVQRTGLPPAREDHHTHRLLITRFETATTRVLCKVEPGSRVGWSPDGETLALINADGLWIVDAAKGYLAEIPGFSATSGRRALYLREPQWSADGQYIWVGDADGVHVFHKTTWQRMNYRLGMDALDVIVSTGMSGLAALAFRDGAEIEVHSISTEHDGAFTVLEGHTKRVTCARFSPSGDYLASMSTDNTVRIWRRSDWQCVAVLSRESISRRGGLAFHPTKPLLAIKDGNSVDIVRLDYRMLGTIGAASSSRRYANAKVVLVGDTGVGKSGLGLVLSGQQFEPTESTHGRNVWTFEKSYATTVSGEVQTRETLLWDLAGQAGYRMVHQLHLNEVAVALVVFDARSETDPFAGVQYWSRALAQARRLDGAAAVRLRAYLVAARTDRGGTAVGTARIQQAVEALGFDGYVETSAKEGWGVDELIRTVRDAIDWDAVPAVSSTALFQEIKDFVLEEKKQGRILTTVDDLLHSFRRVRQNETPVEELADGFSACLGRLESVGVVRRMAFGDYVLLRPELLDAYASSLVQAAKDEPDGLGFVSEKDALEGRFRMPESERLTNPQQERILLITVVEELLRREIALKEVTDREVDLIFPSQFTRERPDAPQLPGQDVVFTFDGDLHSIYSTLAVRLSHSRLFQREAMWHNSASYHAEAGGTCGIAIREIEEGRGELVLFYDEPAQPIVRRQFEAYVVEHLEQRAVADTVDVRRVRRCKPCDYAIDDEVVRRRLDRGLTTVTCQICEAVILIVDQPEVGDVRPAVAEMNSNANARRDQDVATTTLKGKREAGDYDVFLCHNVKDKPQVLRIAKELEARGILPWLDVHAIQPGSRWQQEMAKGIEKSRSAAVLIGPAGPGPWHEAEMELISDWSARNRHRRVIPVILDGTGGDPVLPGFLRVWSTVDMRTTEPDPIEQLSWGITGEQPNWT